MKDLKTYALLSNDDVIKIKYGEQFIPGLYKGKEGEWRINYVRPVGRFSIAEDVKVMLTDECYEDLIVLKGEF